MVTAVCAALALGDEKQAAMQKSRNTLSPNDSAARAPAREIPLADLAECLTRITSRLITDVLFLPLCLRD